MSTQVQIRAQAIAAAYANRGSVHDALTRAQPYPY